MRPIWEVDASMAADGSVAADESVIIDLDGASRDQETIATVLAARCHVALLESVQRGDAAVDEQAARLRRRLTERTTVRGAAGRRRIERAVTAVRTGRTGRVTGADLTALVDDLRVLAGALRGAADSAAAQPRL